MFKAFVALVASMVGGALLLASIEPGITLSSTQPALLLHAQGSRPLSEVLPWSEMRVLCVPEHGHKGLVAKGIDLSKQAHLVIDAQGLLSVNSSWRTHQQLQGFEGAVVIYINTGPPTRRLNEIQVETLEILLQHLSQGLNIPASRVRLESLHSEMPDLGRDLVQIRNRLARVTSNDLP